MKITKTLLPMSVVALIGGCGGGKLIVEPKAPSVGAEESVVEQLVGQLNPGTQPQEPSSPAANPRSVGRLAADLLAANSALQFDPVELPERTPQPQVENRNLGRWGEIIDWPHIAAGAASLPDGRLATWSASDVAGFSSASAYTHSSIFDPSTGSFVDTPNERHNLFGASLTMASDGSVIAVGGGHATRSVSALWEGQWLALDDTVELHSYGQSISLPNGDVAAILGDQTDSGAEYWNEDAGWSVLNSLNVGSALRLSLHNVGLQDDPVYEYVEQEPAFAAIAPDGRLFYGGPAPTMFSLAMDSTQADQQHGLREGNNSYRINGSAVSYDVGKWLYAGGGKPAYKSAITIDLNGSTPVQKKTSLLHRSRSMHNTVLLPTGQVMVIGGTSAGIPFSDEGSVFQPELWDAASSQWKLLAPHQRPRNYQSTAMLLQDGRVIAMGGGLCGECKTNHQNAEIYSPPYLFDDDGSLAVRPEIVSAPAEASFGASVTVNVLGALPVTGFSLIRLHTASRHHSPEQRYLPVEFTSLGADVYELMLPDNVNVLLPGYYWLVAMNGAGVPSKGRSVRVLVGEGVPANVIEEEPGNGSTDVDSGNSNESTSNEGGGSADNPAQEENEEPVDESTSESDTSENSESTDEAGDSENQTGGSGSSATTMALPAGSYYGDGDLLALHFDIAADIDDIHAIAAARTITHFYGITPAVVIGAYGFDNDRQATYHVPFNGMARKDAANEVATLSFGSGNYLDTKGYQEDFVIAASAQADKWQPVLEGGNDIWVAEGGPSDFTEEVLQQLIGRGITTTTLRDKVHVYQHSIFSNEGNTDDQNLIFVKENTDYITLENGNQPNQTADLNTGEAVDDAFRAWAENSVNAAGWEFSMQYFEEKLDFSDTVELLYILNIGTDQLADTADFALFFAEG